MRVAASVPDVDAASTWQVCCSVERVYVAQSAKAEFEALVMEEAARWASAPNRPRNVL